MKIIPLSRLAQELHKSEPDIEAGLKDDGYILMTPEQFAELLDKVEQAVLDWLTTDFEGDPRTLDGDGDGLIVVDVGVDEYWRRD